ncbi:MAG TPA: hypothetical protein VL200_17750 [Lacunisphaera sp.]|jgi:hypothetical protein|nr:hypothetical protein [Lacunisphaera sp.]
MNNKILTFALVLVVMAGGIAFRFAGRQEKPGGDRNAPNEHYRSAAMAPLQDVTMPRVVVAKRAPTEFRAWESSARRGVEEVFPGCVPPERDWRNRHPSTLRVSPYPGVMLGFEQTKTEADGRVLTWVGRDAALPGATFVGIATPDGYDAVMLVPGAGQFNFHERDGRVVVEEVSASGADCELTQVAAAPRKTVPAGLYYAADSADLTPTVSGPLPDSADSAPVTVDVLFLYNTRALAVAASRSDDPIGYIDAYSRAGLETCNQVLQNSRVDAFRWHYVGLVAVPAYPEQTTVSDDLAQISPDGPLDATVRDVRARYGADQVMMWTGAGTRQGAAYAGDIRSDPVEPEYALASLRLTAGILILGHELAHNFGCQHDRGHAGTGDGSTATPDGDGLWCYGLLWPDPVGTTTSGTVMAYADFLVPYFSNPDITLEITSTLENRPGGFLNLGTRTIGFPESDPHAANNARVLREHAAYIANLNEPKEAAPVILQQPKDASLTAGQTLSLTVSASGGGLRYQWFKDGGAIEGAVADTYATTFKSADAGRYSVRVTNTAGSALSREAIVAVTASGSPPTPAGGGGTPASSGGGGGALSPWFLAACLALAALRHLRRASNAGRQGPQPRGA